jgi:hypothetical protein
VLDIVTGRSAKHTWENKEKLLGLTANDVAKKIVEMYNLPITWEEYKMMAKDEMRIVMRDCEVCEGKPNYLFLIFKVDSSVNIILSFKL